MYSEAYKNFDIDLADIWREEQHRFNESGQDRAFYDRLSRFLQPFYVRYGQPPFISKEMVAADHSFTAYYQNYFKRLEQGKETLLDFFEWEGRFYGMDESCVVQRENVTDIDYQRLLTLKLRQYEKDAFFLYPFLDHHLKASFANNPERYGEFLEGVLTEQGDMLSAPVQKNVKLWTAQLLKAQGQRAMEEPAVNPIEKEPLAAQEKELAINNEEGIKDDELSTQPAVSPAATVEGHPGPPPGYRHIEGRFTDQEAREYFIVLLCHVNSPLDGSFSTLEEVDRMFQFGLALPPQPLANKVSLRYTPRYPKRLVEYGIYFFVRKHAPNESTAILQFFGAHLTDFEKAFDPKGLINLKSNYGKPPPDKKKIDYEALLPERLRHVPKHKAPLGF